MKEDDLPWDYREEILRYRKPETKLLENGGCIQGRIHRFYFPAKNK